MQSILVGVDRSESSRRALAFSLDQAAVNHWAVTAVYVINWSRLNLPTMPDPELRPLARKGDTEWVQTEVLDPLLQWARQEGHLQDTHVETQVRHGRPSEVLAEAASAQGHHMIVVGRTGESDVATTMFGSTPSRLVQHATVPVVVVP